MTELTEGHTVRRFDSDLGALRLQVLEMAGLVLQQVQSAVHSLVANDDRLARTVIARDLQINDYDEAIATQAVDLLARRAPVAGDLRVVMAISRAVRDLERIGDEAKKIALYSIQIHTAGRDAPLKQFYHDVRRMGDLAIGMLREAVRCFDALDAHAAAAVRGRDDELDAEFRAAIRHLVTFVLEDQRQLKHTINTVFVVKSLERVGDHAVNIADGVLYLVTGRTPRKVHQPESFGSAASA